MKKSKKENLRQTERMMKHPMRSRNTKFAKKYVDNQAKKRQL